LPIDLQMPKQPHYETLGEPYGSPRETLQGEGSVGIGARGL
jgi:hypothetical protein